MEADEFPLRMAEAEAIPALNFVPYFFRANRPGNGQMRVGLQSV